MFKYFVSGVVHPSQREIYVLVVKVSHVPNVCWRAAAGRISDTHHISAASENICFHTLGD